MAIVTALWDSWQLCMQEGTYSCLKDIWRKFDNQISLVELHFIYIVIRMQICWQSYKAYFTNSLFTIARQNHIILDVTNHIVFHHIFFSKFFFLPSFLSRHRCLLSGQIGSSSAICGTNLVYPGHWASCRVNTKICTLPQDQNKYKEDNATWICRNYIKSLLKDYLYLARPCNLHDHFSRVDLVST